MGIWKQQHLTQALQHWMKQKGGLVKIGQEGSFTHAVSLKRLLLLTQMARSSRYTHSNQRIMVHGAAGTKM